MSDTKLLPCPFCGSQERVSLRTDERVSCQGCGTRGPRPTGVTDREGITAWNTRPAPALTPKQAAADTPEQMRERCFHDFLRLIQACIAEIYDDDVCVLQTFKGFVERHGIPGLGTGTCDCGADDCPYKTASVPCDCGLPDCTDPRIAAAQSLADALEALEKANDRRAELMTGAAYEASLDIDGMEEALNMLDRTRSEARAALAAWEKLQ